MTHLTSSSFRMLHTTNETLPTSENSFTVAFSFNSLREAITTLQPSNKFYILFKYKLQMYKFNITSKLCEIIPNVSNSYVMPRPIPVAPPVTMATRSLNNFALKMDISKR